MNNILNKDFMNEFDDYSVDQFIFRDLFRNIKSFYNITTYSLIFRFT